MPDRFVGIKYGMPFEEYAAVDALSGSALAHMRRSPMNYRWHMDNPQPPTDAMKLGTVIHTAILEPPLLGKIAAWGSIQEHYTDGGNLRPRNSKLYDAWADANAGLIQMTKVEYEECQETVKSVYESPAARKYLCADGETEVSLFWFDKDGRYWKGRIDKLILTKNTATIVDLKKARSCSSYLFGKQAFNLGYHVKAAIYRDGIRTLTGMEAKFHWIAMESKPPYECAVYRATSDILLLGGEECDKLVRMLGECERTQNWPPEQEEEEDLILPAYALAQSDALDEFAEVEE